MATILGDGEEGPAKPLVSKFDTASSEAASFGTDGW